MSRLATRKDVLGILSRDARAFWEALGSDVLSLGLPSATNGPHVFVRVPPQRLAEAHPDQIVWSCGGERVVILVRFVAGDPLVWAERHHDRY